MSILSLFLTCTLEQVEIEEQKERELQGGKKLETLEGDALKWNGPRDPSSGSSLSLPNMM